MDKICGYWQTVHLAYISVNEGSEKGHFFESFIGGIIIMILTCLPRSYKNAL